MARNNKKKPGKVDQVQPKDEDQERLQSQILPEAPDLADLKDQGLDFGYEAAGPQHLSDEDLGLDEILNQLGESKAREEVSVGRQPPLTGQAGARPATAASPLQVPVQMISAPVPLSERTDLTVDAQDTVLQNLIQSAVKDFDEVGKEVLNKWREDRAEVQVVIDHLRDAVINRAVQNATGAVPSVYVESLVNALEVKGNMSLTAVKALEAKTRLLAAMRGGVNILNQQNVTPSGELERVLAGPVDDDFGSHSG
jgi:hypothetical protein